MTLQDAKIYINYGIKEGFFDVDMFIGMTDKEFIEFAEKAEAEADYAYESSRENQQEKADEIRQGMREDGELV